MKIHTGYPINPSTQPKIEVDKKNLIQIGPAFDPRELDILSSDEERKLRYEQANIHQSTVIVKGDKIIASFGENGWRHFVHSSDANENFINMSNEQVIDVLQRKYGKSLSVNRYAQGEGPTRAELFERVDGRKLKHINEQV